jgi:hypothetical protein
MSELLTKLLTEPTARNGQDLTLAASTVLYAPWSSGL